MSPSELDESLQQIRWTPDILARALGCEVSLIHAWLSGELEVPLKVGVWIKIVAEHHVAFEQTKPRWLRRRKFDA